MARTNANYSDISLREKMTIIGAMSRATNYSDSFNIALAQVLQNERNAKKLTQMEVSGRAGLTHQYIGYIERGVRCPTVDVLVRIAMALGVKASTLVARAEKMVQQP